MFKAYITLAPHFNEVDVARLASSVGEDAVSSTALRQENRSDSPWVLEWLFEEKPDSGCLHTRLDIAAEMAGLVLEDIPEWTIEPVETRNWLEYCYAQFPPFTVGPFYIYGAHSKDPVPEGLISLQIDAATAFGSGEHGTTKGCLQAMLDLKGQGACPWNVLDMGTGSGILAIAAWKLWKTPIVAVDNDPESIAVTRRHMDANDVREAPENIQCYVNEGFAGEIVQKKGPYELIIANILPGPLKAMAEDIAQAADDNGHVILSGILNEQAGDVIQHFKGMGLILRKEIQIDGWSTLVMQA